MIVDSSRDALLLDGGDGGSMSSPLNLAFFYGASPHSSEGSCSPVHSAPGSPGSDSELSSSGGGSSSSSSGGDFSKRRLPRSGAQSARQVGQHMGGGKQQRGPFQGVRVKNSVKELLLHIRSSKQMSDQGADELQVRTQEGLVHYDPYTVELKNILTHGRKRKAHESISDGSSYKRTATFQPHLLTPPQTPTSMDNNMEDAHLNEAKQDSSCDMLQNIINIKNESNPVSLNTVQVSWLHTMANSNSDSEGADTLLTPLAQPLPGGHQQADVSSHPQTFSLPPTNICRGLEEHGLPLPTSDLSVQQQGIFRNTAQLGKSFFQWQVEQEEQKLANISQDQILAKDSDGDTFLHIAVAQGRRAVSYVLARKMAALHVLDIKEHNGQVMLPLCAVWIFRTCTKHPAMPVNINHKVVLTSPITSLLQAIQKGAIASNQYVDLEATNYDGLTALHCAVVIHNAVVHDLQSQQSPNTPEVQELRLKSKRLADTIKFLIQMGASVEARDRKSGRSALHFASEEANVELLRLFLEQPTCLSFINAKAYNGNTALHVAASLQHRVTQLDAVRCLMRKGADPSARNLENEQPVHLVPDGPVGVEIRRILKGKTGQLRSSVY
ncbi:hypothetical protein lerEdw1_011304 [Lerista edwardsae]|nr:hypothetical protein lerEdw1_011304 [Lerista edwardsae]